MAAEAGYIAGLFHAWVATRDSNGYPMGSLLTPDSPVQNTVYDAYYLADPVETTVPEATVDIATFRTGLTIKGQRTMGVSDFGSFTLTLGTYDETFNNIVGGSAVDESTASALNITSPNMANANYRQLFLGLSIGFQNTSGTNQFITQMWSNVQIAPVIPSGGQDSGVNPRPLAYTVTPSLSTRTATGLLYSATSLSVQNDKDVMIQINYTSPVTIATWADNASATTITTAYLPVSAAVDGSVNIFTDQGVEDSGNVSAFSITTAATTHTAADAGDIRVVTYPTNFIAP